MARHPHLYRRQAVYWWRRRIPKNLRPFCQVVELRVTLRTYIAEEAATRAARLRIVTDLAFQDLERAVTTGLTLPDQAFDQLVKQLVQDELDRCERELAGLRTEADIQQAVLDHQRQRARLQQALRYNAFGGLEEDLASAVNAVQAVATQSDLAVLRRRAVRGLLEATYTNEAREQGLYSHHSEASQTLASGMDFGISVTGRQHPPSDQEHRQLTTPAQTKRVAADTDTTDSGARSEVPETRAAAFHSFVVCAPLRTASSKVS